MLAARLLVEQLTPRSAAEINQKSKIIKNENIYNKLYQDSKIYTEKKVNRTINHLKKESEDLTFNPKVNNTQNETRDDFLKTIEKVIFFLSSMILGKKKSSHRLFFKIILK